mmetsp:Transcript_57892/g.106527  ORF Transcript_57892/g.106527 Transcript_57892/m.106527 type:complete len:97 (+) Transcript_57892:441-731(+)
MYRINKKCNSKQNPHPRNEHGHQPLASTVRSAKHDEPKGASEVAAALIVHSHSRRHLAHINEGEATLAAPKQWLIHQLDRMKNNEDVVQEKHEDCG